MTFSNGVCDFCGLNTVLLSLGGTMQVIFYVDQQRKLWCGECRDGSDVYFMDYDSPTMVDLIRATELVLLESENAPDASLTKPKRIWLENEVYRAKKELVFRVLESDV